MEISLYRILLLFALWSGSILYAGDLVRYSGEQAPLENKLKWAFQAASAQKSFWIGFSIPRFMHPNDVFVSGVSLDGNFRFKREKPTLQEWLYDVRIQPGNVKEAARDALERSEKNQTRVWKEVGIFLNFKQGATFPERTQVMSLTISHSFRERVYWLGTALPEESFRYLSGLYAAIKDTNQQEDLLSAIGIHPPAQSFPFLKNILFSNQPQDVQETAAVFVGELDTPEALQLLIQVTRTHSHAEVREAAVAGLSEMTVDGAIQAIEEIARSSGNQNVRETALAMLGDKGSARAMKVLEEIAWFDPDEDIRETAVVMLGESDAGVPALLKIMEDHPSRETRESAVHTLAETVAGRRILKEELKQTTDEHR